MKNLSKKTIGSSKTSDQPQIKTVDVVQDYYTSVTTVNNVDWSQNSSSQSFLFTENKVKRPLGV